VFNKLKKSFYPKREVFTETNIDTTPSGFEGLKIEQSIIDLLSESGFTEPTPVQEKAIPPAIDGLDLVAIAQTGTGKTLAFGIPMVQRLNQSSDGRGLILVPTRELAAQVDLSLQPLCQAYNMKSTVIIGGVSMDPQYRALRRNPDIIIATPGRLLDHIARKTIDLSNISILVLDEADRMLDMGFAPAIIKIIAYLSDNRQTMLFSATMPGEILVLARKYMISPVSIEIARSGTAPEEITHEIFYIDKSDKVRLLELQLRKHSGSVLIFCRTKHGAKKLTRTIRDMGHSAIEIHSNRTLGQRSEALAGFKSGRYRIMVATDIAARGLDVTDIMLVINFDLPSTSEDYIHRIGRTGRAGKEGHAISFATFEQEREISDIEKLLNMVLPVSELPFAPSARFTAHTERTSNRRNFRQHSGPAPMPSQPQSEKKRAFGRRQGRKR
jgi:ATP-dependent RNA helicase RhlE